MYRFKLFNTRYIVDIKKFKESIRKLKEGIKTLLIIALISYIIFDFNLSVANKKIKCVEVSIEPKNIEYEEYIVQEGDSLWNIADYYYPELDNRETVDLIKKDNLCSSNLKNGQVLKIRK